MSTKERFHTLRGEVIDDPYLIDCKVLSDAVKDIRQVYDDGISETTIEAVNSHLDILRPAIKNYGGGVEVLSVEGGDCRVKYVGPESIGTGIKTAIKEKFPDIVNVVFTG